MPGWSKGVGGRLPPYSYATVTVVLVVLVLHAANMVYICFVSFSRQTSKSHETEVVLVFSSWLGDAGVYQVNNSIKQLSITKVIWLIRSYFIAWYFLDWPIE